MPLPLLRTALLTVAAAGTLAAPAAADTFCVGTDGCSPTVQAALDAAAAHPGFDEVHIGPGTYAGPFTYLPADPAAAGLVHIFGAGPSATKLTYGGTGTALRLGVEASKVKSLAISAPGGTALELPDFGTAGDLDITARTGLRFDSAAGRVAGIDRTRIVAERDGLVAAHGKVYAFDSLIKVSTAGHAALAAASAGGDARIEASHVTIVGAGTADTGVEARAGAHAASVALRDSIVHGFDHEIVRSSTGAPATVEARYTRVDGATALDQGAGSIALTHTTTADPRFGAGYKLLPDSPLIDAAEPGQTASAVDLAGNPRIVARVPGGAPLSDMGALETQPGATAAPVGEPAPGPADPADTFEVKVKQRQRGRFVIARVTPSRYAQVRGIAWIGKRDGKWAFGDGQAGETIRLRVPVPRFKGSRTTVRLQLDVSIGRGVVTKNRKVRVIKR